MPKITSVDYKDIPNQARQMRNHGKDLNMEITKAYRNHVWRSNEILRVLEGQSYFLPPWWNQNINLVIKYYNYL